jgi:hypothetical protein
MGHDILVQPVVVRKGDACQIIEADSLAPVRIVFHDESNETTCSRKPT